MTCVCNTHIRVYARSIVLPVVVFFPLDSTDASFFVIPSLSHQIPQTTVPKRKHMVTVIFPCHCCCGQWRGVWEQPPPPTYPGSVGGHTRGALRAWSSSPLWRSGWGPSHCRTRPAVAPTLPPFCSGGGEYRPHYTQAQQHTHTGHTHTHTQGSHNPREAQSIQPTQKKHSHNSLLMHDQKHTWAQAHTWHPRLSLALTSSASHAARSDTRGSPQTVARRRVQWLQDHAPPPPAAPGGRQPHEGLRALAGPRSHCRYNAAHRGTGQQEEGAVGVLCGVWGRAGALARAWVALVG